MTDFDIDIQPGVVWDEINSFNEDVFESKLKLETNIDKKWMKMTLNDDEEYGNLVVKMKFFELKNENEINDSKIRYRLRFIKKRGCLVQWYKLFKIMQETSLKETLLATRKH